MTTLWLTDPEIDDLCAGLRTNGAKARHLEGMGLVVNRKPNGRPLVVRSHAEAVLSGLAHIQPAPTASTTPAPQPNRDALVLMFKHKKAAT